MEKHSPALFYSLAPPALTVLCAAIYCCCRCCRRTFRRQKQLSPAVDWRDTITEVQDHTQYRHSRWTGADNVRIAADHDSSWLD